jgi:hypothetical protein
MFQANLFVAPEYSFDNSQVIYCTIALISFICSNYEVLSKKIQDTHYYGHI